MKRHLVGIIGCGPRAQQHAEAFRTMQDVEIAGAADLQPERLHSFCDRWEIKNRYTTATALLAEQNLDLITIVTLPEPRLNLVTQCAAAGVPVINAEKNIAYRISDVDAMIDACRSAGSLLTVNHQMRFLPQFQAVADLVRSGRLGRILTLKAGSRGHLMEQGPHVMDQMLFMNSDSPAEWVLGQCEGSDGYLRGHRSPSSISASIRFANGCRGILECGLLAPEPFPASGFWLQKHIEVTGTGGWAGAYVNDGWRALLESGERLSGPGTWEPNWPAQAALFRAGLDWIEDRSLQHPCRADVALMGMEALLAVCQSSIDRTAVVPPINRGRDVMAELQPLLGPAHGV